MKKNIIGLSTALVLTFSAFTTSVFAAQNINLKIDGVIQNLDIESTIVNNNLLVDAETLGKALGAQVQYSEDRKSVTLTSTINKRVMVMTENSRAIKVNGQSLSLPVPTIVVGKNIYVPARFVAERAGASVNWIDRSKTIVITTGKVADGILNLSENVPNINDTDATNIKVVSYKSGLEYAVTNNSQLKNLRDSKKVIEENIKDAEDMELAAYRAYDRKSEISAQRLQKQLKYQLDSLKENETLIKTSTEMMYRTYFTNIISSEIDKQLVQENIALEKINVKNTQLKFDLGMESAFNVNQAKEKLKQLETQLNNINISIRNNKEVLSQYLGYTTRTEFYIDYDIKYAEVPNNVYAQVATKTVDDPQLIIYNRDVLYYEYVKETSDKIMDESEAKIENDILTAKRKYNDTIASYEKNIRSTFNTLKQLEESRASLKIDINLAKENYNKAVANFEAGLITIYDVQGAKVALLSKECDLLKNQLNYDTQKFMYNNPSINQ